MKEVCELNRNKHGNDKISAKVPLLRTNISPPKALLKITFLFPGYDMFVPWRVHFVCEKFVCRKIHTLNFVVDVRDFFPPELGQKYTKVKKHLGGFNERLQKVTIIPAMCIRGNQTSK